MTDHAIHGGTWAAHGARGVGIAGLFARWMHAIVLFRQRRQAISELNACSDRMLEDIGITRGDISEVVHGRRFGH